MLTPHKATWNNRTIFRSYGKHNENTLASTTIHGATDSADNTTLEMI